MVIFLNVVVVICFFFILYTKKCYSSNTIFIFWTNTRPFILYLDFRTSVRVAHGVQRFPANTKKRVFNACELWLWCKLTAILLFHKRYLSIIAKYPLIRMLSILIMYYCIIYDVNYCNFYLCYRGEYVGIYTQIFY